MAQLTRKQKVKLARKMRTPEEIRNRVSIWNSKAWTKRKEARTGIVQKATIRLTGNPAKDRKQPFWNKVKSAFTGTRSKSNRASLPQKVI